MKIPNCHLININNTSKLNEKCGAEYVHKKRKIPIGLKNKWDELKIKSEEVTCVVFDGDADRILYFFPKFQEHTVETIDGDKILTLLIMAFFTIC